MENVEDCSSNRRAYMREYKRNQYKLKGDEIRANNKAYYYRSKHNLAPEDLKKYGKHLPLVHKVKTYLAELQIENPLLLQEIIEKFFDK